MSEEFTQTEDGQIDPTSEATEVQVQPEVAALLPSAVALFTGGIKMAMSRLDIIGIVFATTLGMGIISVLLEYGAATEMSIPMVVAGVIAVVVSVVNGAVLIYAFANNAQQPSYVDGVQWLGKKFFPYIWLGLCVAFLKMGGFVLFIIPGVILSVYAAFSIMVFAAEDKRGFNAIMRSRQLVYGRFWKTVGVFSLLSVSLLLAVLALVGLVVLAGDVALSFVSSEELVPVLVMTVIITVIQVIATAFGTGLVAHVYGAYAKATPVQEVDTKVRKKYVIIAWLALALPVLGILMSVVLASLNSAQDKGQDALVKMTVMNMNMTAEIHAELDAEGNALYVETCETLGNDLQSLSPHDSVTNCNDSFEAYAVEATLADGSYYCIDSEGFADNKDVSIGEATSCE